MKFKKKCFSTQLSELYGRDEYQSHIEVNREYWYYFSSYTSPDGIVLKEGWHKIKITYIRSGCVFYVLPDYPDVAENFCPLNSFMASALCFAEINPTKDLKNFGSDEDKKLYCFDTEHTIVEDWPNEKEVEIDENDDIFLTACIILKELD
jgi:hypothetical protein